MKKIITLFFILVVTIPLLGQNKYTTYYYQRVSLFEKLKIAPEDVVFIGNSITDGGEWSELFNNPQVKNRGISGDICEGVYDRLDSILIAGPNKIFLMIGINDMGRGATIDSVVVGIEKIIDKIQWIAPKTELYLQSILPVNDDFGMFLKHTHRWMDIKPLNEKLFFLANSKHITYIDLYSHFVAPGTDKLDPAYTNDGLHLLGEGYLKWVEIVKGYY